MFSAYRKNKGIGLAVPIVLEGTVNLKDMDKENQNYLLEARENIYFCVLNDINSG